MVDDSSDPMPRIDPVFRNGSLTAVSVVVGFSLSFLNRWASLPGPWHAADVAAVMLIAAGIIFQIVALAQFLSVKSLELARYERSIRRFLMGVLLVSVGVALAIAGDITGLGMHVLG